MYEARGKKLPEKYCNPSIQLPTNTTTQLWSWRSMQKVLKDSAEIFLQIKCHLHYL